MQDMKFWEVSKGLGHEMNVFLKAYKIESVL
jgi:hypothetical protein